MKAAFPNCEDRQVLYPTEGGPRVHLSMLHQSFSQSERSRWYRQSLNYETDQFGTLPAKVEAFLRKRQREMW